MRLNHTQAMIYILDFEDAASRINASDGLINMTWNLTLSTKVLNPSHIAIFDILESHDKILLIWQQKNPGIAAR